MDRNMERDFLGLAEASYHQSSKDSVPMRGPMQWSFSNKVSAIPQFLSFKGSADEKQRKTVHDPIQPSSFMSISTADAYDSNHKQYPGFVQKCITGDKHGNQYGMTNYVTRHQDAYPVHRPQETRIFPFSNRQNQAISVSISNPVLQPHFAPTGNNLVANSVTSPPLGGVPILTPISVIPAATSIIGTTELRNIPKPSPAPAQLTIFYAGSVCVYEDVSPEKAQAVMLLAGNGSSVPPNATLPKAQVHRPIPRPSTGDGYNRSRNFPTLSCSGLPSPISISSSSTNELTIGRPVGTSLSSCSQAEPTTVVSPMVHVSGTLGPAVAVPQARKASLARFLEKRKERVTSASPYNVGKRSPERDTLVSNGLGLSINCSSSFASSSNQLDVDGRV